MIRPADARALLTLAGERLALELPAEDVPLSPQARRKIEDAIEALIGVLDAFDGDADLEEDAEGDDADLEEDGRRLPPPIDEVNGCGQV